MNNATPGSRRGQTSDLGSPAWGLRVIKAMLDQGIEKGLYKSAEEVLTAVNAFNVVSAAIGSQMQQEQATASNGRQLPEGKELSSGSADPANVKQPATDPVPGL